MYDTVLYELHTMKYPHSDGSLVLPGLVLNKQGSMPADVQVLETRDGDSHSEGTLVSKASRYWGPH